MIMNRIAYLLVLILALSVGIVPLSAYGKATSQQRSATASQGKATSSSDTAKVAAKDSLIAVDEDQLVPTLIQLVKQQQLARSQREREITDWLRTQLLAEAFGAPNTVQTVQQEVPSLTARLAQLEQVVQKMVAQQRTSRQGISPDLQQALNEQARTLQQIQQENARRRRSTAIVPVPLPINATRNDSLQHQLQQLQAQLAQLQGTNEGNLSASEGNLSTATATFAPIVPNALLNAPQQAPQLSQHLGTNIVAGQQPLGTNHLSLAQFEGQIAVVPADFERSLFFQGSSATLGSDAQAKIAETVQFLTQFPTVRIQLRGYASPEGSKFYNDRLAKQRQLAVQRQLMAQGISPERIVLSASGINRSQVGAQVARRVDISLLK